MDDEFLSLPAVCLIRQFSAANHHRLKCELKVLRESRSRGSFPLGRMTQVHVSASIGTRLAYILNNYCTTANKMHTATCIMRWYLASAPFD